MGVVADAALKKAENDNNFSASLLPDENGENFKFTREDWRLFCSLNTLPQQAGAPLRLLRRLVLKELTDNALDAGGSTATIRQDCQVYVIEDDGPGMDGTPDDIAFTFSVARPLVSSKMWRLPTRGALGNGLRVAVGSVLASAGTLVVTTRNMRHVLSPRDDGTTGVASTPADMPRGTRVEISFGPDMPADPYATVWADLAIVGAAGEHYGGKSSPYWYDADHFFELLRAAGPRPVRALIEEMDGCSGAKAGHIAADYRGRPCSTLNRGEAVALLGAARSHAKQVNPKRLGSIGEHAFGAYYAIGHGTATLGARHPKAEVAFVVEAWAELVNQSEDKISASILVNRTPVASETRWYKEKKSVSAYGCGLGHSFEAERGSYRVCVNILSPVIPITTSGKEPDLSVFAAEITSAVQKAIGRARRAAPKAPDARLTQKEIITSRLSEAIARASGSGEYAFNQRQLFYAIRPFIIEELGVEPTYGNFSAVITDFEAAHGEIAGMHRDPRGTLYHPHTGYEVPLGTRAVADYERPRWCFNKVLFVEKEGFFETLKTVRWPERYDCAIMSTKGFSSRAAKDFLDMLADDATEDVTVFCVHDADASGTMIHQTLQEETKARPRRKVEIINLGLEPWEGAPMGLAAERVIREGDRRAPVADYVRARDDGSWDDWLQTNRYELNAMTMPQFLAWLDAKMAEHGVAKVMPPVGIVQDMIYDVAEESLRRSIEAEILAEADVDGRVARAMDALAFPDEDFVDNDALEWLVENPTLSWRDWTYYKAAQIVGGAA